MGLCFLLNFFYILFFCFFPYKSSYQGNKTCVGYDVHFAHRGGSLQATAAASADRKHDFTGYCCQ